MPARDKRIDAFIAKAQPFAKPILTHIRDLVHAVCPDVEESIKWGMPAFSYHGTLLIVGAFREHVAVNFWKGKSIFGDDKPAQEREGMGSLGKIHSLDELPNDRLFKSYLKKAVEYNVEHEKSPLKVARKRKPDLAVPPYLSAALLKNKKAGAGFDGLTPGKRREYIEWLEEAKTEATRDKRLEQTLEWVAEGKSRNWKYESKAANPSRAAKR
jgi:uncharacterized protein YdeI (YjbR/CyaY-like superfamily)